MQALSVYYIYALHECVYMLKYVLQVSFSVMIIVFEASGDPKHTLCMNIAVADLGWCLGCPGTTLSPRDFLKDFNYLLIAQRRQF